MPEVLEVDAKLRPGSADEVADIDLGTITDLVVDDTIPIPQLCGNEAGGEYLVGFAGLEADCNHGLGRGVAVTAEPVGVHKAIGEGGWDGESIGVPSGHVAIPAVNTWKHTSLLSVPSVRGAIVSLNMRYRTR